MRAARLAACSPHAIERASRIESVASSPPGGLSSGAAFRRSCKTRYLPLGENDRGYFRLMVEMECKPADSDVDRGVRYLRTKYPKADAWQISASGRKDYVTPDAVRVAPALTLLATLT